MVKKNSFLSFFFLVFFATATLFAQVDYAKKMKLNKNYFYYKAMGDRFRIMGKYPEAMKNYEYALVLNSNSAESYYHLGEIKYQRKMYIDAVKELEIAITKKFSYHYDRIKAYFLLSSLYFTMKKEGKAIESLEFLVQEYENYAKRGFEFQLIEPHHYAPAFFIIGLYYRNNDLLTEERLSFFKKCMELNYKKDFCNYFIYEFYKSKKPDVAFRFLNQALTINPQIQLDLQKASWLKDYMVFKEF